MNNETLKLKGELNYVLKKANGDVETGKRCNLILNVGFDFIADAIGKASSRPACMAYTAVGTGTTAVSSTQTALVSELARKAATYAHTANTKVFTFTTNFARGEATGAITEAGIVNASSNGIFLDRVTFAVINKGTEDELTTTFQFTLS